MPQLIGSTRPIIALVAMAASAALPPALECRARTGPPAAGWWPRCRVRDDHRAALMRIARRAVVTGLARRLRPRLGGLYCRFMLNVTSVRKKTRDHWIRLSLLNLERRRRTLDYLLRAQRATRLRKALHGLVGWFCLGVSRRGRRKRATEVSEKRSWNFETRPHSWPHLWFCAPGHFSDDAAYRLFVRPIRVHASNTGSGFKPKIGRNSSADRTRFDGRPYFSAM